MSQETIDTPIADEPRPAFEWTRWKIVTFSIAGVLVLGGALLAFAGGGAAGDPDLSSVATGPGGMGATPTGGDALLPGSMPVPGPEEPGPLPGPGETPEPTPGETAVAIPAEGESGISYSPAMLRGGISFFAAFALAFAFRSFLKLALILVGIWFGVMFYLSWLGWIDVRWDVMDTAFQSAASGLGDQFKSVQAFITGSLPSTGMAGLGLYTGFRRK